MTRIPPLEAPHPPETQAVLEQMTPAGVAPIALFRTFAHNLPMTRAMRGWGSYELSRELSLSLRDREIVIDRTCARCRCEYELGVHVALFAARAELDEQQVTSLVSGGADDRCWPSDHERTLIRAVDALHDTADIGDELWAQLTGHFTAEQVLELTMLCGWYHAISFTALAVRVPLEDFAPRFAALAWTERS
jgi:alkylhydroperoxidase family enzyme